jgi:hypothetical protein
MNPLLVFYILTFFIIDISLNSCMLTKIYLFFLVGYWVLYFFIGKSRFHDTLRKWYLASYSQSYNPSIFSSVKLNLENAKKFIEEHSNKIGKKISFTLFFTKVLGECLELLPEANLAIRYGKVISCLIRLLQEML